MGHHRPNVHHRPSGDRPSATSPLFSRVSFPAPLSADRLAQLEADGYEPAGVERDAAGLPVEYVFLRPRRAETPADRAPVRRAEAPAGPAAEGRPGP
jgi:hypothetical protein